MRSILATFSLLALGSATALAGSAFSALQSLSPEQRQSVAVIAGRDGTPEPERWHILLHDPKAEAGLREVVVIAGRKSAERIVSQFAESLTAADVILPDTMKADSDFVGRLALQYGAANGVNVSALHFELRKSGPEAAPLWTVICMDMAGGELGKLVVSAARGTIIMHPGFEKEPSASPVLAAAQPTPAAVAEDGQPRAYVPVRKPQPPPRKRATPAPTPKPGFFNRVFGGGKQ